MSREIIEWNNPADKLPDDDMSVLIEVNHFEAGEWAYSEVLAATKDGDKWRPIDSCEPTTGTVIAWADWPVGPKGIA